ncbi:hypothetical protein ABT095_33390 [Kitasatospora sp. NPDC002227]|uniref:hypothetical protein n=1 Tax=Kitasatospora sp. NPDC002227 TaxID=3154773 RepID=UPI003321E76B
MTSTTQFGERPPQQRARAVAPDPEPAVPPRRAVPDFAPIRRGAGGRHRLQQAVRHRPGVVVAGLLAASTSLTAGPLRHGPLPPLRASPAAATAAVTPAPTAPEAGFAPGAALLPGAGSGQSEASTRRRRIHP